MRIRPAALAALTAAALTGALLTTTGSASAATGLPCSPLDGHADLAVGAPYETVGTEEATGSVTVIPGAATGLSTGTSYAYNQGSAAGLTTTGAVSYSGTTAGVATTGYPEFGSRISDASVCDV